MTKFKVYTEEDAPPSSKAALGKAKEMFGMVPNLLGLMAESPSALKGYLALTELLGQGTLTPGEAQIVLMTISFENGCHYCVAAHTAAAKRIGVADEIIEAVRGGQPLPDSKWEALHRFACLVVQNRGWVSKQDVEEFLRAGYNRENILEVILAAALKTLSNYTNHIAETPLDAPLVDFKWEPLVVP